MRCVAKTRHGKQCTNRARWVYTTHTDRFPTPTGTHREYLCGRHVGPLAAQSPNLTPLVDAPNERTPGV